MPFPALPTIETERLLLRAVEERDLPDLLAIHGDDEVTRYLSIATWTGEADARAWFERVDGRNKEGSGMLFAIVERGTGIVAGTCVLFRLEEESMRAEVGYALGKAHRGRGYLQEAMTALIDYAFEELSLRRLEAEADPRNLVSDRALRRLGFTREGLLRKRWIMKGEVVDSHVYGLLREEWPARATT
ncbi:MAG TPA: GNAT family protein [Paucimonas sp.]|nr:GNAT family protein [Paucimonas sp.]